MQILIKNIWFIFLLCSLLASCALLQQKEISQSDCKKNAIKELKRLKKYLQPEEVGKAYTYLYQQVKVPDAFETIFWERKLGREFGINVQLVDTTEMQYLQLVLSLQDIIYSDCAYPILKDELELYFGEPTFETPSFLEHASISYHYSFNLPNSGNCYHGEYMGNVAYQDCLSLILEINNKNELVEINSSSFDVSQKLNAQIKNTTTRLEEK